MLLDPALQLHRLVSKTFIRQLLAYTACLTPAVAVAIRDCRGKLLLAEPAEPFLPQADSPILVDNQQIGSVFVAVCPDSQTALPPAAVLAHHWGQLLSQAAQLQWERRCVTVDSINRYRELALLHQLGEKMRTCLSAEQLAAIILTELNTIIKAAAGSLMLCSQTTGQLLTIDRFGSSETATALTAAVHTLAKLVCTSGKAEIIDAAGKDSRLAPLVSSNEPLLCVPLKIENRVLGVLNFNYRAGNKPFSSEAVKLTEVIAAHAANAFETARLFKETENMAYAVILAASATIDERDDCTANHSARVAQIARAIAGILNKLSPTGTGELPIHLREIEYAALLHDIGKIGVPEAILNKRSRLTADRLLAIKSRFDFITATTGRNLSLEYRLICRLNAAHKLTAEQTQALTLLSCRQYTDLEGNRRPLLWPEEQEALEIPRGNLIPQEVEQIQSHAEKSYRILKKVPFPAELSNIPLIAYQHHERLNGAGYPQGLTGSNILLAAKILSVADVFEALTATDRPYRSAVPPAEALEILRSKAAAGCLDRQAVTALAHILHTDTTWFASLTTTQGRNGNDCEKNSDC